MVLPGITRYCLVLLGIKRYYTVLPGIGWYCPVLPGIARYCPVLPSLAQYYIKLFYIIDILFIHIFVIFSCDVCYGMMSTFYVTQESIIDDITGPVKRGK